MTDEELEIIWTPIRPNASRRQPMEQRVFEWVEAKHTPLATEWLHLFTIAPVPALGLITVSAIALVAWTPLAWVARALL